MACTIQGSMVTVLPGVSFEQFVIERTKPRWTSVNPLGAIVGSETHLNQAGIYLFNFSDPPFRIPFRFHHLTRLQFDHRSLWIRLHVLFDELPRLLGHVFPDVSRPLAHYQNVFVYYVLRVSVVKEDQIPRIRRMKRKHADTSDERWWLYVGTLN